MAYGLGDIISKATNSLPLPRLGRWDVQVLNEQKYSPPSDSKLINIGKSIFDFYDNIKETVSDAFSWIAGDKEAFQYKTIASFDSFIKCAGEKDSQIVSQAIEQGSFRSVNKVVKPMVAKVTLAKGGFYKGIETCLDALKELQGSTRLCRIVTPFGVAKNLNLAKLTYSYKTETGAHLLIADLDFIEILQGTVTVQVKNPVDSKLVQAGVKAVRGL